MFEDIIGNDQLIKSLKNSIAKQTVTHAYIFDGDSGMGKSLIAKTFAKALICSGQQRPCGVCSSCGAFDNNNHPDVMYIKRAKSTIGVDVIRDEITKTIDIKPYYGGHKIIIVDDANSMTPQAQNAILKTLENPPLYAVIIFLSTNINDFLPTILSRAIVFKLKPLSKADIKYYLQKNGMDVDDFYLAYASGNIGRLNKLLSDEEFISFRDEIIDFLINLENQDINGVFANYKLIENYKDKKNDLFGIMALFYRDAIALSQSGNILQKDKVVLLTKYAKNHSSTQLIKKLYAVKNAEDALRQNANFQLTMEVMMLNIRKV